MPRPPQNRPRPKSQRGRPKASGLTADHQKDSSQKERSRPAKSTTREILDGLFLHPPVSRAELEQRLAPASVLEARRAILDRLEKGRVEENDGDLLVSIFHILGIGQSSQALMALVSDPRRERHVRAYALTVLLHADPQFSDKLRELVSEDELLSLAAQPMCQFLCHIESDLEQAEQLALTLEAAPDDLRLSLFNHLEQFRQKSGVPAAVAYESVVRRPLLAELLPTVLTALGKEGGRDAVELLESLRSEAKEAPEQRKLLGLVMRLRTRMHEGRTEPLGKTRAHISSCDGQSAFFVLGERRNPDATYTLALLCIRAAGDIRDGYVATRQPEAQVKNLLSRFITDAGTEFVEVPLESAAPLVEQAVQRTLAGDHELPEDALPALRFFERALPRPLPEIAPARRVTLSALRALLAQPPYRRSWFIDASDLETVGLTPPRSARPTVLWLTKTQKKLAKNATLLHRVAAMAGHMAMFHRLRGEQDAAGLCLAAAEEVLLTPQKSALLRVLLERLFLPDKTHAAEDPPGDPLGEPNRRQFLKSRFFLDVASPKGKDLALLDLTEAALLALERALETVSGDARPREDIVYDAAHSIARLFRDYVLLTRHSPPTLLSEQLAEIIATASHLPAEECHRLSLLLLAALVSFVDEVCGDCPVRCISRPRADVAAEFFSPMHPALPLFDSPGPRDSGF